MGFGDIGTWDFKICNKFFLDSCTTSLVNHQKIDVFMNDVTTKLPADLALNSNVTTFEEWRRKLLALETAHTVDNCIIVHHRREEYQSRMSQIRTVIFQFLFLFDSHATYTYSHEQFTLPVSWSLDESNSGVDTHFDNSKCSIFSIFLIP